MTNIGPVKLRSIKTSPTEPSLKTAWKKSIETCTEKLPAHFQRINQTKFLISALGENEQCTRSVFFNYEDSNDCILFFNRTVFT